MLGINKLLAFLRRSVGLRDDAASATGSLHAKVAAELARIGTVSPATGGTDTLFKYLKKVDDSNLKLTPRIVFLEGCSTSIFNVVNISGSGYLTGITQSIRQNSACYAYLEVIIDGVTLWDGTSNIFLFHTPGTAGNQRSHGSLSFLHRFNTSLIVRYKVSSGTATNVVSYILT